MAGESHPGGARLVPLGREEAADLRQVVRRFAQHAPDLLRDLLALIDRREASSNSWRFVMVGPLEEEAVLRWLCDHAKRLRVSIKLWAAFRTHLHSGTNQILMTRALMVERAGTSSAHVSEALAELLSIGALKRVQCGRDVQWFMCAEVATHLTGAARDEAQQAAPLLLARVRGDAAAP